jgi:uncharacterized protein (TIGR03382 family)
MIEAEALRSESILLQRKASGSTRAQAGDECLFLGCGSGGRESPAGLLLGLLLLLLGPFALALGELLRQGLTRGR